MLGTQKVKILFHGKFATDYCRFICDNTNKKNVQSLEDYIRNEVYKLCSDEEIKLNRYTPL